jgi:hypothetical protein
MSFMTSHHVHLIAFHGAREFDLRLLDHDTVAKNRGDFLDLCFVPPLQYARQLLGDLPIGQVQTHKIQAQHPYGQWLMPVRQHCGEHGFSQVIEGSVAHSTEITLSIRLSFIWSIFDDFGGVTMRALNALGPTKAANHLVTLGVIDQSVNVQSHPAIFTCLLLNHFVQTTQSRELYEVSNLRTRSTRNR